MSSRSPFKSIINKLLGRPSRDMELAGGNANAFPGSGGVEKHIRKLTTDFRYTFVLHRDFMKEFHDDLTIEAWKELETHMALVPGGVLPIVMQDMTLQLAEVGAIYLDRYAVSNEQYGKFVQAGCYEELEIWPQEIWPALTTRFLDKTKQPGPADWDNGKYPAGKANHPVVGICWHEAVAYARWVGKRLPTAAEWQKAGGFPEQLSGGNKQPSRYPWGEIFAEGKANLFHSGAGATVSVKDYKPGATRNGIYQMSGNVWEWLDDSLETIAAQPDERFYKEQPMRRIIGGAYDTYLISEATNFFVTGQGEMDRRPNIGFRCAVSLETLRPPPGSYQ